MFFKAVGHPPTSKVSYSVSIRNRINISVESAIHCPARQHSTQAGSNMLGVEIALGSSSLKINYQLIEHTPISDHITHGLIAENETGFSLREHIIGWDFAHDDKPLRFLSELDRSVALSLDCGGRIPAVFDHS